MTILTQWLTQKTNTETCTHLVHIIFAGSPALVMVVQRESGLIASSVGFQWLTDAHTDGSSEHNTPEQNNGVWIIQQEQL